MIRNQDYSRMLVGVGKMLTVRYNMPDESEAGFTQKEGLGFFIADGNGSYREPTYTLGVTEKPYGLVMARVDLLQGYIHKIKGHVTPPNAELHFKLSSGYVDYQRPENLFNGEWQDTQVSVTPEGEWTLDFKGAVGPSHFYAFAVLKPTALVLATAGISVNSTEVEPDTELAEALDSGEMVMSATLVDLPRAGDNGATRSDRPTMRISGTCSEDVEWVYICQIRTSDWKCPTCGGSGCEECGHTGIEMKGDLYKFFSKNVPFSNFCGFSEVVNGRFSAEFDGDKSHWKAEPYDTTNKDSSGRETTTHHEPTEEELSYRYAVWCVSNKRATLTAELEVIKTTPPCLSGDTPITMADGTEKALRDVRFGDMVLSGSMEATMVVSISSGRMNPYHTLYTFEDGTVIDESANHRFYDIDLGYWAWLRDWRIGDRARRVDGTETALVSRERVDEPAECFGLWTESRDYWAGGLLSGETMANQRLLADATVEQAADMLASLELEMVREMMGCDAFESS